MEREVAEDKNKRSVHKHLYRTGGSVPPVLFCGRPSISQLPAANWLPFLILLQYEWHKVLLKLGPSFKDREKEGPAEGTRPERETMNEH